MRLSYDQLAGVTRRACNGRPASASQRGGSGRLRTVGIAAALLALPADGLAQGAPGVYTPPNGCTLNLTVQERGCTVTQHFTCTADAPGDQRTTVFGRDGEMTYESRIDRETRWMWSRDPQSGIVDRLEDEAPDHASFSTLINTGRDDFDFWTVDNSGYRMRQVGEDRLTGETITIDGEPLERTRFQLTTSDESGKVLIEREGGQYISRSLGRFFGGVETARDWSGASEETDGSPVEFIRPGEPGFGGTEPRYDCEMLSAGLGGGQAGGIAVGGEALRAAPAAFRADVP